MTNEEIQQGDSIQQGDNIQQTNEPIYKTKSGQIVTQSQLISSKYTQDIIDRGVKDKALTLIGDTKYPDQEYKTSDNQIVSTKDLLASKYTQDVIDRGVHEGALIPIEKKNPLQNTSKGLQDGGSKYTIPTTPIGEIPVPKNPIDLSFEAFTLGNKKISTKKPTAAEFGIKGMGTGEVTVYEEDTQAKASANKIKEDLKSQGYDADKLYDDFKDIDNSLFEQEDAAFSKDKLINDYKQFPQDYEKEIATLKLTSLHRKAVQNLPEDEVIDFQDLSIGGNTYEERRQRNRQIADKIKKYGGDYEKDLSKNFAIMIAEDYGNMLDDTSKIKGDERSKYLNESQLIALQYLEDTNPDAAKGYGSMLVDPSLIKKGSSEEAGWQEKASSLEQIGLQLYKSHLQSQIDKLKGQPLDENGTIQLEGLESKINDTDNKIKEINIKYPIPADKEAKTAAMDLTNNSMSTWYNRAFLSTGKAIDDTWKGIYDFATEPFRNDEQSKLYQLAAAGESIGQDIQMYLPKGKTSRQSYDWQLSPEISVQYKAIMDDKSLSEDFKTQKLYKLLQENPSEFTRIPIIGGKTNITPTSLYYSVVDLGSTLVPYIALESATGGGATAGILRKISSSFMAAAATGFHDNYVNAIREGAANPYKQALTTTAIMSAAMAGAGTAGMIKNMLSTKTAAGQLVSNLTDAEITKVLDKIKNGTLKNKILDYGKTIGKDAVKSIAEGAKGGAKFETIMGMAKAVDQKIKGQDIDVQELAKEGAIGILNFTAFGGITGVGKSAWKGLTDIQGGVLLKASENPIEYLKAAQAQLSENLISKEDYNKIKNNIELASKVAENIKYIDDKGVDLSEKKKAELLLAKMQEAKLNEDSQGDIPSKLKEDLASQTLDIKNDIEKIQQSGEEITAAQGKEMEKLPEYVVNDVPVTEKEFLYAIENTPNESIEYNGEKNEYHEMLKKIGGVTKDYYWNEDIASIPEVKQKVDELNVIISKGGKEADIATEELDKMQQDPEKYFSQDAAIVDKIKSTYEEAEPSEIKPIVTKTISPKGVTTETVISPEKKAEEIKPVEVKEEDTIELPAQVKGGLPRKMIFKEGSWKQQVGDTITDVGENIKQQAQTEFDKKTISSQYETIQPEGKGTTGEIKINSEKVQYNGTDAIGSRERSQSEKIAARKSAKEKIKNLETNAVLKSANTYNTSVGLPEIERHEFKPSDPVKQTEIANLYPKLQDVNSPSYKETDLEKKIYTDYKSKYPQILEKYAIKDYKDLVKKSYAQLIHETELQFNSLPVKVSFHEGDKGYENSSEMMDDVHNFNHLWVFKGGDDHTELGSKTIDKNGITANDKFRAVHDYETHAAEGYEFGKDGEENAWIQHSKMFSPLAQWALSSETRGQNSFVNYSGINTVALETIKTGSALKKEGIRTNDQAKINEGQKLIDEGNNEFKYAEQKAMLLPPDYVDMSKFHKTVIKEVPSNLDISKKISKEAAPTPSVEAKPKVPVDETKTVENAKEISDKIRSLKIDLSKLSGGGLQSNIAGIPVAIYNTVIESIAKAVESGVYLSKAIKDAVKQYKLNENKDFDLEKLTDAVISNISNKNVKSNPVFFENLKEFANKSEFENKIQFKKSIQDLLKSHLPELKKIYGKDFNPSIYDERTKKYLSDVLTQEAFNAVTKHPESIGWYDEKTQSALDVVSTIHPEIATDKEARGAFILPLAVMSNGNKVDYNFDLAEKQYRYFKENGRFNPNGEFGAQQAGIRKSLMLINSLLDNGLSMNDINNFLTSKYKAKDLKIKIDGKVKDLATGELADEEVYGATILGSKIGNGFYMNLWGEFDQLTMDRWFMRTWGRLTGTLIDVDPSVISKNKERVKNALLEIKNDKNASAILKDLVGNVNGMPISDLANLIEKKSTDKEFRAKFESNTKTKELKLASNSLAKNIRGEKEAPSNGTERKYIRDIFSDVKKRLKDEHNLDISMADLQAALWYPEKILYESFKKGESFEGASEGYTEDSAPDYLNAAKKLAKKNEITDEKINETLSARGQRIEPTEGESNIGTGQAIIKDNKAILDKIKSAIGNAEVGTKEKAKNVADNLRKAKIDLSKLSGGGLQSNIFGIPISIYNSVIETIAISIEKGASLIEAVNIAIEKYKLRELNEFDESSFSKLFTTEPKKVGLSKAEIKKQVEEFDMLPPSRREKITDDELDQMADDAIEAGYDVDDLVKRLRVAEYVTPNPLQVTILNKYAAALNAEQTNNPSRETLRKYTEVMDAARKAYSSAGATLRQAKRNQLVEDNVSNFLVDKEIAQGAPLSEKQMAEETAKYKELKKSKDELEAQLKIQREAYDKLAAEVGFNKARAMAKKAAKKSNTEYVEERKASVEAARAALKNLRTGQSGLNSISFGVNELMAIAPHVKDFVKSLANQGVDKLDNVITQAHAEFKDVLEGLSPKDIRNIIAGKYDEVKETRNELAAKMRLLQREAKLLNELDAARKGEETAKTEKERVEKSRRIQELEAQIKQTREINNEDVEPIEKTNAERLATRQKQLLTKIDNLTTDLKEGNFAAEKKELPPLVLDRKTIMMMDKVAELENKIKLERDKDNYEKKSKWIKGYDKFMQVLGLKRIVQTAVDLSVSFRQGATLLSPRQIDTWGKSFNNQIKSIFSSNNYNRIMYEIRHSNEYHDMVKDGIVFNDLESVNPEQRNEEFQKSFVYKIPVLREPLLASQRAADGFLNTARYELYMKFKRNLENQGITRQSDPEAYKEAAKWAMNMTGRGNLIQALEHSKAQAILGNTFYGARLMASRFNLLNPNTYRKLSPAMRKEALKDITAWVGTTMAVGAALAASGAAVSLDPDDSDFLQVKYGNKRYDISGGMVGYVRTFLRLTNAIYDRATKPKREADVSTEKSGKSVVKFFRNKLAPNTAYATDAFFGKGGKEEFDPYDALKIYPMYVDDVANAYKEDGVVSLATVLLPNLIGIGYNSYEKTPSNRKERKKGKEGKERKK